MKREYRGQRSVVAIADFIRQQQVDPVKELLSMEETNSVDVSGQRSVHVVDRFYQIASFLPSLFNRGVREISSVTLTTRTLITTTRMKRLPTSFEMTAHSRLPLGEPPIFRSLPKGSLLWSPHALDISPLGGHFLIPNLFSFLTGPYLSPSVSGETT